MSLTYTDIFCGFGGSSIGLEAAGLELKLAANHWDRAIEVHSANFPGADHLIADVSNYDMRRLPRTDVLWASPICTELSPAGGRRRNTAQLSLLEEAGHVPTKALDRTRATFWDVVRATEVHRYKVILIENVVEAASWELFDIWLSAMDKLGYNHQFVSVSSAHVGDETNPHAPQWRDRLYIVFTAVSLPLPDVRPRPLAWCPTYDEVNHAVQSWKRPERRTIGKYRQQYDYRCPNTACRHAIVEPFVRPASTAIDWRDLGERIGDRSKPLAAATMRRIQAGIDQFGTPTMISVNHDDGGRAYPAHGAPMPTRSTKIGDGVICPPFLVDRRAYNDGDARRVKPISEPVGAITANGRPHTLVTPPMLVPAGGSWNDAPTTVDEPMRTRMTRDIEGVFTPQPWITVLRNHADVTGIDDPLATVTTGAGGGGHQALTVPPGAFINAHLLSWCEQQQITFTRSRPGNKNDGCHVEQKNWDIARRTVGYWRYDTAGEIELLNQIWPVLSVLINLFTPQQKLISKTRVGAKVSKRYDRAQTPYQRLLTHAATDPMPGVVARPNLSLVIPYRKGKAKTVDEPLHTVATRDSAALVAAAIDIDDCHFRMLKPREHGPRPTLPRQLPDLWQPVRTDHGIRQRRLLQRRPVDRRHHLPPPRRVLTTQRAPTMPEISIAFTVPVQVLVDTDTGEVTRVVVIDEQVTAAPNGHHEDRDSTVPPNQDDIDAAYEIAQGAAEWPAWDFGW